MPHGCAASQTSRLQWRMSHDPTGNMPLKSDTFGR
ncbi:serine/threonine protein kinase, partial [Xanthomonas oryzae pv. oryzae]